MEVTRLKQELSNWAGLLQLQLAANFGDSYFVPLAALNKGRDIFKRCMVRQWRCNGFDIP